MYNSYKRYYRDMPAYFNTPEVVSRKTANKKELATIRQMGGIV